MIGHKTEIEANSTYYWVIDPIKTAMLGLTMARMRTRKVATGYTNRPHSGLSAKVGCWTSTIGYFVTKVGCFDTVDSHNTLSV